MHDLVIYITVSYLLGGIIAMVYAGGGIKPTPTSPGAYAVTAIWRISIGLWAFYALIKWL